jgi:N-acetylglucosamine kinase-like BadF-type ATPase
VVTAPARRVLVADGGASKTDLVLLDLDGAVLAAVRGPGSNPDIVGTEGCLEVIGELAAKAAVAAGLDASAGAGRAAGAGRPLAELGAFYLAGVDLPVEERRLEAAIAGRGWTRRTLVGNDTFAVLRAGTARGWGVATVCGTGVNCAGVAPNGRSGRYPALGGISGDWGGGLDVGMAALGAANRGRDGRGPRTSLERLVPAHFDLRNPSAVTSALHFGRLELRELARLSPVVFAASREGDQVAGGIVDRLADELVVMTTAMIRRLRLARLDLDVVCGGGLLQAGEPRLERRMGAGIARVAPRARLVLLRAPPITGAALLALEAAGAGGAAVARARAEVPLATSPVAS